MTSHARRRRMRLIALSSKSIYSYALVEFPMEAKLSPSYSHEKLENPSFSDLVDVFEDLWRHCLLKPVELLLRTPNCAIAAMTVLCPYFESIAGYISGEDTNGRSKYFFVQGFCKVFRSDAPGIETAAEAIYKHVRCGLGHEGMLSHKVNYSDLGAKAFFLTYPKAADGSLNTASGVSSIIVNPIRMHEGVVHHFNRYVRSLRDATDHDLIASFQKTVKRQWSLGTPHNVIGMTESEFLGRA